MTDQRRITVLRIVAGSVLVLGLALTARTARLLDAAADRIQDRVRLWETLLEKKPRAVRAQEALARFEALPNGRALALNTLLQEVLPGVQAERAETSTERTAGGWTVKTKTFVFDPLPFEDILRLVGAVESASSVSGDTRYPPWRLVRCDVWSSRSEGSPQVQLVFEALEKTNP